MMAKYMEVAKDIRKEVQHFIQAYVTESDRELGEEAAVKLGHIINLAIRACPRGVQGTVRKNIVQEAMADFCRVSMTRETDERTGREYNKIHIASKGS